MSGVLRVGRGETHFDIGEDEISEGVIVDVVAFLHGKSFIVSRFLVGIGRFLKGMDAWANDPALKQEHNRKNTTSDLMMSLEPGLLLIELWMPRPS